MSDIQSGGIPPPLAAEDMFSSVASTLKEVSPEPIDHVSEDSKTRLEVSAPQRRERVDSEALVTPSIERAAAAQAAQRYDYMRNREDLIKSKSNRMLMRMFHDRVTMMLGEAKLIVDRGVKATSIVNGIRPYLHLLAPDVLFRKTAERMGRDRAGIHIDVGTGKHDLYTFVDEESEKHSIALKFIQECAGRQQSLYDSHRPLSVAHDMHAMRVHYAATSALLQNLNDLLSVMRDQYVIVVSTTAALTAIRQSGLLEAGRQSSMSQDSTVVVSSEDDDEDTE